MVAPRGRRLGAGSRPLLAACDQSISAWPARTPWRALNTGRRPAARIVLLSLCPTGRSGGAGILCTRPGSAGRRCPHHACPPTRTPRFRPYPTLPPGQMTHANVGSLLVFDPSKMHLVKVSLG